MVYPGLPPDPNEPVRRGHGEHDAGDDLDISLGRRPPPSDDLTTGDWLLCVLCSGIACIVGIVRLIQGKPGAGKMVGVALLFCVLWSFIRFMIEAMLAR